MVYNGFPYCDNMPFYAIHPSVDIVTRYAALVKYQVAVI